MSRKILIVLQKETSSAGRVGAILSSMGYTLDIRAPDPDETLPRSLESYDAVAVFGGPMSANDDETIPFVKAQLAWIPLALESGKPFLGICLGAQLLARVLGAPVKPHDGGMSEIGYYPIWPTPEGAYYFEGPLQVYHWHAEGFDLPRGAELLARGEVFPHQAFRFSPNAVGLQFHPEITAEIIERWTRTGKHRLAVPGAQSREEQLLGIKRHDNALARWVEQFLPRWLERRVSNRVDSTG